MRIFVTLETICYLVTSQHFKRRATTPFFIARTPCQAKRAKTVWKSVISGWNPTLRDRFFFPRVATPIWKKWREATGPSRKYSGVQVNFLVILEDHHSVIAHTYGHMARRGKLRSMMHILHIHWIFVNRRVPWREKNGRRSYSP